MNDPSRIPLKKAFLIILLSTLLISGSSTLGVLYYRHLKNNQRHDPAYQIVAIVQTSLEAEGLKTAYLAQILDLSMDRPKNLYAFDVKEATRRLLECPIIKDASIAKIRPGTLHVDYTLRKPIAFLSDYADSAIDAEGVLFPIKPFFTPKKLPEIYLGWDDGQPVKWGRKIAGPKLDLAFALLNLAKEFCDETTLVSRIDVSKAFALSYGQRQIVMILEDHIEKMVDERPVFYVKQRILRLMPDNFRPQFANYRILNNKMREEGLEAAVIDLRLSDLAFIGHERAQ